MLIPTDPITTAWIPGGEHVGQTVYVAEPSPWDGVAPPSFEAHDPSNVRQRMVDTLRDDRIPVTAWAYRDLEDLCPDRVEADSGSVAEYERLAEAVRRCHSERDVWFDREAFDEGFSAFLEAWTATFP